jgi:hypothetical protein
MYQEELEDIILAYTNVFNLGRTINKYLRQNNEMNILADFTDSEENLSVLIKSIDNLIYFLESSSLPEEMILYRRTIKERSLPEELRYLPCYKLIGKKFTEYGFLSTSKYEWCIEGKFGVPSKNETLLELKIKAHKGAKGVDLTTLDYYKKSNFGSKEYEVLFAPKRELLILEARSYNNVLELVVEIIN